MDYGVASFPHEKERFPYSGDDVGRPQGACFGIRMRFDVAKVAILESSPLISHAALEDLAPSDGCLFVDKAMKGPRVLVFVERDIMEPCV